MFKKVFLIFLFLFIFISPAYATEIVYSDDIQYNSSSVNTTDLDEWTNIKEILINYTYSGSWVIEYELMSEDSENVDTQIYLNGVPYNTAFNMNEDFYVLYQEIFINIDIKKGDLIQIYGKTNNGGDILYIRNFAIKFDISQYNVNPYNYINIPFNRLNANSVYWVNSEVVILLLIIITISQLSSLGLNLLNFIKRR